MLRRSPWALLAAVALALVLWLFQPEGDPGGDREPERASDARSSSDQDGLPTVRVADLPSEARQVLKLIDAGGPFAHPDKDGSRFGNYEGLLPQRPRGHYREYTVPTPGLDHRGARRIVTGRDDQAYWSPDHYESFVRILQ